MQELSFSRNKMNPNLFFWMQTFFQNLTSRKIFDSKSNALYFFQTKMWRVVKLLNQNLTRCIFLFQNLTRCNFLYSKSAFQIDFLDSPWNITKMLPTKKNDLLENDDSLDKKIFYECVACVCVTFGTKFLVISLVMALGFLMSVMTISFALPIDLYKSLWISENG